jgi:adenosylmethionine-8-amino-7-oxononanoate aminotransferase
VNQTAMSDTAATTNAQLNERSRRAVWHPCTQMKRHEREPLLPIVRAEGAWLVDAEGRRYLDAVSSWWVNLFGHGHPAITAALKDQLDRLDHVMLAGLTHEPVIALSERLAALTGLGHASYGSDGASATEIALKMSAHCWRNLGRPEKCEFVGLAGGYHGETVGALSVTDLAVFREAYAPLVRLSAALPSPDARLGQPGEAAVAVARRASAALEAYLDRHHARTAALIVEPLVQCAAGFAMHDAEYLRLARALCDRYQVHLICDEIAVGFGRTGTLFAHQQAGIEPDFICLSKGLTGGTLPLSAVLTTNRIYAAFYAEYSSGKAFLHSHSYTGNPIACRAALATLSVLRDEPVIERNRALAAHLAAKIAPLADHAQVADVRQTGLIAAIELVRDKATHEAYPSTQRRGLRVYRHGLERGVVLRPLGNVVYFMPPYCITPDEIDWMVDVAAEGIERAVAGDA